MLSFILNIVLTAFDYLLRKNLCFFFFFERVDQFLFFLFYTRHVFINFLEFKFKKKRENKVNKTFFLYFFDKSNKFLGMFNHFEVIKKRYSVSRQVYFIDKIHL